MLNMWTRTSGREKSSAAVLTIWLTTLFASLLPTVAAADKVAADYYVHSLPGQPDGPFLRQHAGHVEVNSEHNGNLFFWLYQNRHIADRRRTVIWLNGGPGCSSEDGALMEIGPYRVGPGGKLSYNNGSWDEYANLLFVDNPVGTGFSYVNTDSMLHELQEMADQFMIFLEKWFTIFPEFETDDLYIAGESYAGQHIPYIAKAVQDRNAKNKGTDKTQWNLKGLIIGNGWIAPVEQYQAYLPFAYSEGLIQGGTPASDAAEKAVSNCLTELAKPDAVNKININACEHVLNTILMETKKDGQCFNMYDVRLKDTFPSCGMNWPPDLEDVTPYLRREDVTAALHINPDKRVGWQECSGLVSAAFRAANSVPSVQLIPKIIENGVPVLLFSGAKDMICNHVGTEDFLSNMKWNGATGFETYPGQYAPKREWTFEGQPAGFYQEARNLTYVLFHNSSHMVPFDYPERTRDMLDRFMGIDVASMSGTIYDSHIEGEVSRNQTYVPNRPDNTASLEDQKQKLHEAALKAYYRSGEAALVFVIIGAALFGLWVWRGRRGGRAQDTKGLGAYMSLPRMNGDRFRDNVTSNGHARANKGRDLEAGDFDESELDTLPASRTRLGGGTDTRDLGMDHSQYDLASDSDEDDDGIVSKEGR